MNVETAPSFDCPLQQWISHDDCGDNFHARLARDTAVPTEHRMRTDLAQLMLQLTRTQQTSEIVHQNSECDLESMASNPLPALTRGNSVASTASGTNTDVASVIDGGFVLESEDGILTVPARHRPTGHLICLFEILECRQTFSDLVEFKIHVFSHFRGHPLPTYAPCFVCGQLFAQRPSDDNALAWNNLLNHMARDHYRGAEGGVRLRPNLAVMRYMWNRGIITDAQFTNYQLLPALDTHAVVGDDIGSRSDHMPEAPMAPSAPVPTEIRQHLNQTVGFRNEPYTNTAGRRQDRRQFDQLRARVLRGPSNL